MESAEQSRAPNSRILNEQQDLYPLHFVTYNHPSEGRARKSRKVVRSHVAKLQHEKTRQKKSARGRKLSPESESVSSDNTASRESSIFDDRSGHRSAVVESHEASPLRNEAAADSEVSTSSSSSRPASRLALPEEIDDSEAEPPHLAKQLGMARVNPFSTRDSTLDWTVDVPSVIDGYLEKARIYLVSQGMVKVAQALHGRLVKPQIYLKGLLFNAVTSLSVTSIPAFEDKPQSDAMILWLRTNFLMAIQTAMREPSYDPNALAIGIALLIAWELDVGSPSLCQLHLRALPSIVAADTVLGTLTTMPDSMYREQGIGRAFRGGKRIPSGFEFYRSQNLLPPSLMFHVGSLVYWDESASGASYWMRQLWSSIAACAPVEENAQRALAERRIGSRVAQLVRQAGIMLGSFMRSQAGERPVAQPQLSGIQAQWHSTTLCENWSEMIGSVYDGILLWCLCVFCVTSGYQDQGHLEAISLLLSSLEIRGVEALSAYLSTYVWPSSAHDPLAELCSMNANLFEHRVDPNRLVGAS